MPQSFAALYVHIVFSTKHREPTIPKDLEPRLFAYFSSILANRHNRLIGAGGVTDHGHLLASISRENSISHVVRDLKANSSAWIHKTNPGSDSFAWQTGYGAFSVSHSALGAVNEYIAEQERHHRTMSFQEEFLEFLKRHDLAYNERYLWD